ncbi:MAG: hypothetical protein H0V89_02540 [Deltaproteobacteria bacterium]|nr:hypothetical protein [Deltaproteobacteria bacterium]
MWFALLLLACDRADGDLELPRARLDTLESARRASMAVRGHPLSLEELDALVADPDALPALVDAWLETPAFGQTIRDLHQELLWTRVDGDFEFPARGPLEQTDPQAINGAVGEGPLVLAEEVVRSDLPYDDILTVPWTMVDPVLAVVYGLPHDPSGPTWQRATWTDGRPAAGLLADNGMWLRHRSSDTNFERERANAITRLFLCQDFASADLPVLADGGSFATGGTGPLGEPACAGCHAAIDPIGSYLWGFRRYILPSEVRDAYTADCRGDHAANCYPFRLWVPEEQDRWSEIGMPAPGLFGVPGDDLADLGRALADHPSFPSCTASNFASWLTQSDPDELPFDRVAAWTDAFESSGRSAKALVRAIVLDEAFTTLVADEGGWAPGLQHTRPEQWARSIEVLTGFRFLATPTAGACEGDTDTCWGEVDLLRTDRYGFRLMMGGISGYQVTEPTPGPTPTRVLALERAAFEAAGTVVAADLALPPVDRQLLTATADGVDDASVRAELVHLHRAILGMNLTPIDPEIDAASALWLEVFAASNQQDAWKTLVAGLLMHPAMVSY